mgnify:CR=1 FL=1|tara:strand:- start:860 stop:1660 length:801 start_codon:yes stop_codon:yes gene_type:complete
MNTIQLLNGETFSKKELLDKMMDDDFYYNFLGKNALSSSSIKLLLDSPKKYKLVTQYSKQEETPALIAGALFHQAILESDKFEKNVYVDVQSKNTKAYKLAKEEHGKVFTIKEKHQAERLADAFLRNEPALKMITDCEFEVPAIGYITARSGNKYPFRAKADILGSYRICDLKTTTNLNKKDAFKNSAYKYGYLSQAYIYCELFNKSYEEFFFVAVDKQTTDVGAVDLSEQAYNYGKEKVLDALEVYETFFVHGADLDNYCIRITL